MNSAYIFDGLFPTFYRGPLHDGQEYYEVVPVLREPVDTMAAGDSFLTAFLIHYLNGNDISTAMKRGNEFAGESCMIKGSFGYGVSYE